jgi:pyrroline-5-carboxylate reductase
MSAFADCGVVFLATHPPVVLDVLEKLRLTLSKQAIVVSLAPKITIDRMRAVLGDFANIARVNPSAPGIIHQGINPVAFAEGMSEVKRSELLELLGVLGKAFVVPEPKVEAYAVISAMGSTYFWFQLKQLQDLALSYGMDEGEAKDIIAEMLKGTANTLFSSGLPADEVMDLVPVRPLGDYEEVIKSYYSEKLNGIYAKIKP